MPASYHPSVLILRAIACGCWFLQTIKPHTALPITSADSAVSPRGRTSHLLCHTSLLPLRPSRRIVEYAVPQPPNVVIVPPDAVFPVIIHILSNLGSCGIPTAQRHGVPLTSLTPRAVHCKLAADPRHQCYLRSRRSIPPPTPWASIWCFLVGIILLSLLTHYHGAEARGFKTRAFPFFSALLLR